MKVEYKTRTCAFQLAKAGDVFQWWNGGNCFMKLDMSYYDGDDNEFNAVNLETGELTYFPSLETIRIDFNATMTISGNNSLS